MGEPPHHPLPPTTRLGVGATLMGYFMLVTHFPDQVNYTHCCYENHTESPQKQQVNNDLYISNIFLVAGFAFYQPGVLFGLLLWFTRHNWALFSSIASLLLSVILLTTSVIMKALAVCLNTCGGTAYDNATKPSSVQPNPLFAMLGMTLCLATTGMICLMISFCRNRPGKEEQERGEEMEPQPQSDLLAQHQHALHYQSSLPYHEGYKRHSPTEGTSLKEIQEIPFQRNAYSKGLPQRM